MPSTSALESLELTKNERVLYQSLFKKFDVRKTGIITSEIARSLFRKSLLPSETLEQIWDIVDPIDSEFNYEEFCIALRLIGHGQSDSFQNINYHMIKVPGPLPVFKGVNDSNIATNCLHKLRSKDSTLLADKIDTDEWVISTAKKELYDNLFFGLDLKDAGVLSKAKLSIFLLNFQLPIGSSDKICELSDSNNDGMFNRKKFAIAMFLYEQSINGLELPKYLPSSMLYSEYLQSPTKLSHKRRLREEDKPVWSISKHQVMFYGNFFDGLDKRSNGMLNASELSLFLVNFNLSYEERLEIFDLVGLSTGDNTVTKDKFVVVMFLVDKILGGVYELPPLLPETVFMGLKGEQTSRKKGFFKLGR